MGGVDLFDMLMALYKIDHKSTKWYRRIYFWVLNVAIVNGWLLYKRHCQQYGTNSCDQLDLLKFTCSVSQSLIMENKLPNSLTQKRRGRPSKVDPLPGVACDGVEDTCPAKKSRRVFQVNETSRYDNVGHFPDHCEPKQRCRVCGNAVRVKCMKCNCCLCVTKNKNCFVAYHTK